MALYVCTRVSLSNPQLVPASALLILRLLALLAVMSRACAAKVRCVSQDFRGAIQRNHVVTYLDLRVQVRLVGVRGEQCHR